MTVFSPLEKARTVLAAAAANVKVMVRIVRRLSAKCTSSTLTDSTSAAGSSTLVKFQMPWMPQDTSLRALSAATEAGTVSTPTLTPCSLT